MRSNAEMPDSSSCDVGTAGDHTSEMTEPGVCGDGVVDGDEECDDGNLANDDACPQICVQASCGE